MDNATGKLTITNEEGETLNVQVVFGFEVPEFNKNYIVYTFEADADKEDIDLIISEFDKRTYEIKSIPEDEVGVVTGFYEKVKETMLKED